MTPEEQYHICSEAALFISAHGAACSNMIFTPSSTPMIEINFRKDWYCDPVCDQHYHNKISFDTKCNGQLLHAEYHKADFHNLSHLLGKKYYEEMLLITKDLEYLSKGSSLKFFDLANGKADVYPRFAPTMEWDIAAGQAVLEALGGEVTHAIEGTRLRYNKEDLTNPFFIAKTKGFIAKYK
jgi:fructose-1,6-bisphosphatase/inositol monophosphatase family enzyme